jgi:two-component system sensor histidine kinase VicK
LLEEIVQESERMTRLVEDLLFLARSDAGGVPLEQELVNIRPFLSELAERAGTLARKHGAVLRLDLAGEGVIQIDRARIDQAVLNLVDNAAKYSPPGKTITLRSALNGAEVRIEVADQGPGIPAQDLPLIFERFYRVDKARSRRAGGAGLGLAIAKSIITAHGGRIEAESMLNHGTKMRIYLPLTTVPQAVRPPAEPLAVGEVV